MQSRSASEDVIPINSRRAANALARKLRLQGGSAAEWYDLGTFLSRSRRYDDAKQAFDTALHKAPCNSQYVRAQANALSGMRRYEEALSVRRARPHSQPMDIAAIADDLKNLKRYDDAIALVQHAHEHGEGSAWSRAVEGFAQLYLGNYARGFALLEDRFEADLTPAPRNVPKRRWERDLTIGLRLLVLPDQGLGDDLLMLRFGRSLAGAGVLGTFVARKPLKRLLEASDIGLKVIGEPYGTADFDAWCPVCSLPHALHFNAAPPKPLTLTVPEDALARGKRIVGTTGSAFKIGMCWTGNAKYPRNEIRSVSPEAFCGIAARPDVQLFSLYKGPAIDDLRRSSVGERIIDASSDDQDLADAAGVISALDLVISTDTSLVHLAASLGRPVWNLLPFESFWQYGPEGDSTPWYPSMRLFRQPRPGDWDSVFSKVETELDSLLQARSGGT